MKRLYILVSDQLDPIYACVQGGHAVAQWLLDNKTTQEWNNEYLIYLYADIEKWNKKLGIKELKYSKFHEPDLGNKLTSIAMVDDGRLFRNLKPVSM